MMNTVLFDLDGTLLPMDMGFSPVFISENWGSSFQIFLIRER